MNLPAKIPPNIIDFEEHLLGALMIDENCINIVTDIINADIFYKPQYRVIYEAIFTLFADSEPINSLTVVQQLRTNKQLEMVGGAKKVLDIASNTSSSLNIEYYCRCLQEAFLKREVIQLSMKLQSQSFEESTDIFDLLDIVDSNFIKIRDSINKGKSNERTFYEVQKERIAELKKGEVTGILTGLKDLDALTGGFQKSDLVLIAARPGVGKSSVLLSLVRNIASIYKKNVGVFSLEMSDKQLIDRFMSLEAYHNERKNIKYSRVRNLNVSDEEIKTFENSLSNNNQIYQNIHIDDTAGITCQYLRSKVLSWIRKYNIEIIFIDYLQLMKSGQKTGTRENEVGAISMALKEIAKQANIPVIALSQLSRAVETRGGDKRPQLSDLRDSGSLEQDADIIIFPYRPEYYGITQDIEGNSTKDMMLLDIAKFRGGSIATGDRAIQLTCDMSINLITNYNEGFEEKPIINNYKFPDNINGLDDFTNNKIDDNEPGF